MIRYQPLSEFLTEYTLRNDNNQYKPVAVGRYGIRTRDSIYSKELAKDYSKNKVIYKNTLTVGMGSVQIDIGILTEDIKYSVSPAYHTYEIHDINPVYLRYCLECRNQDMFTRFVKRGSRQGKSIDLKRWLTYAIPVFDVQEQAEIVSVLDRVSMQISNRHEQLELFEQLVKSRFIELFGDGNDERFPLKTLPQIVAKDRHALKRGPFGGALKKDDFVESGYLVYEQRHAIHNDFEYEKYYISPKKYQEMSMFKVSPGDLIISCSGVTLGRIAEIPVYAKAGIINQALLKVSLDQSIMLNTFFVHQFRSERIQDILFGFCRGSGIPNFPSMSEVKSVKFICPPIALQEQFAAFVEQTDKSKLAVQKALEELEILKKSLMQQYFG